MDKQAANIQSQCEKCQHIPNHEKSYTIFTSNDWRIPFLEYLIEGILPDNRDEAYLLKRMANRYFVEGGILFRKGFNGEPLRRLGALKHNLSCKKFIWVNVGTIKVRSDFSSSCLTLDIFGQPWSKTQPSMWRLVTLVKSMEAWSILIPLVSKI